MKIPTAEEVSQCEADAAAYRARLVELLEVHEYIDNEDQHQTKMTKEVLRNRMAALYRKQFGLGLDGKTSEVWT